MAHERPFPQAVESERALLGGLIQAPEELLRLADVVRPEDFYLPEHVALFRLMTEMSAHGIAIDLVTVTERAMREGRVDRFGGAAYVSELPEHAPSTANLGHYAVVIREKAALRDLIKVTVELSNRAYESPGDVDGLLDLAAREVTSLGTGAGGKSWHPISTVVDDEVERIEKLSEKAGTTTGHSTGFVDLDQILAGLQKTDLLILAARPAMGKTALALNIAQNVALMERVPVGLFSLEMSRGQLVTRMLCCHGHVDAGKVRTGRLDTPDWDRFLDSSDFLRKAAIHIDDTPGLTLADIRARARRLQTEQGELGLIVIDYLQLMQGEDPRSSREQQISQISRGLKALAKDLNCPVLALSQLNRGVESRQDKRPLVSDLRESGAIEQDADVIMFIYRDEVYNPDTLDKGIAEIIVSKQRNGPTGTVKLTFQGKFTRFDNYIEDGLMV